MLQAWRLASEIKTAMKNFLLSFLCLLTVGLFGQTDPNGLGSKPFEIGLGFETYGNSFVPKIDLNYYLSDKRIIHFSPGFGVVGGAGGLSGWRVNAELWNEYRRYLGAEQKWFFSHGFTGRLSFSTLGTLGDQESNLDWSGTSAALGYKLGIGYKINDHFTITGNINPRGNYQIFTDDFSFSNTIKFQAPLRLGLNYRF